MESSICICLTCRTVSLSGNVYGNTAQITPDGFIRHLLRPKEVPLWYIFSVILHKKSLDRRQPAYVIFIQSDVISPTGEVSAKLTEGLIDRLKSGGASDA